MVRGKPPPPRSGEALGEDRVMLVVELRGRPRPLFLREICQVPAGGGPTPTDLEPGFLIAEVTGLGGGPKGATLGQVSRLPWRRWLRCLGKYCSVFLAQCHGGGQYQFRKTVAAAKSSILNRPGVSKLFPTQRSHRA